MATMTETSYWISFFTGAGIPAGDATHYAVMFTENRITREMLLDLSKEYLKDMGISKLGDVIAILKHCKSVFHQDVKDKILKSTSLTSLSSREASPSFTPRRSTAASRMVNHITDKHPEAAPMAQTPVPRLPPPDPPKSKRKVSVFERLGCDEEDDKVTLQTTSASATSPSVFSRLGGKASLKRAASSSLLDELDNELRGKGSLPYAGILKNTGTPPAKKVSKVSVTRTLRNPSASRPQIKVKRLITPSDQDAMKALNIQRPEVSTTTEGVLSDFAKKELPSLKDRLGDKTEIASSTGSLKFSGMVSQTKMKGRAANIQDRLGAKREETQGLPIVSSTQQISVQLKKERMSQKMAADTKPSGVFSRLGKKGDT